MLLLRKIQTPLSYPIHRGGFRVRQVRQATDINLDENSYD